jgi:CheY-like chemotaxis protein
MFLQALQQVCAPAQTGATLAIPQALVVVSRARPPRPLVLLVDDNETNLAVLVDYLPTVGYDVVVARNGQEAVARAEELSPALIVMDIQMPVLDGLEATRRIRAAGLRDTPIIALTALVMPGDRERCLAAGATEYLAKPISPRTLVAMITAALEMPQAESL